MKKLLIIILAAGLAFSCNNDKSGNDKDKSAIDNREKDDYGKTGSKDGKTAPDDNNKSTGNNSKTTGNDQNHDGWNNAKGSGGWTEDEKTRFMNDCERTASKNVGAARANEYCDCMLQKLMKLYPSYAEADRSLSEPGSKDKLDAMVVECNGK